MGIFKEIPPTAGFPIYTRELLSLLKTEQHENSLENDFRNYLGVDYVQITNSGTAALYLILETLGDLSAKKTVIIPSYICPLVPLAIKRAGLKMEVCDITGEDFNFNVSELESLCSANSDILAIVVAHIGGIPLDFDAVEKITRKYGIFIIEDCAQSLGAIYKGKFTGVLGDFSFFSLCRGKGLTIYEGGILVTTRKEYESVLNNKINRLIKDDFLSESLKILELFGYWIFYRPQFFWFIFRLPQIFWRLQGRELKALLEDFALDFPIHKVSKFRKSAGHVSFYRLEKEICAQRQKAAYYIKEIGNIKGVKVIKESAYSNSRATYPYLTLIFDTPKMRRRALSIFENSGLGISQIYVFAITDYGYLKNTVPYKYCRGAPYLAEREITLSTSTFLKDKDLLRVSNIIKNMQK